MRFRILKKNDKRNIHVKYINVYSCILIPKDAFSKQ